MAGTGYAHKNQFTRQVTSLEFEKNKYCCYNLDNRKGKKMKLHESAENYLETILVLSKKSSFVRSIDVADALNFSKPSVSVAMKKLSKGGYINVAKDGAITLTDKGLQTAEKIYDRHIFLTNWLISIGVDEDIASKDACRMEHIISQQTIEALKKHYEK